MMTAGWDFDGASFFFYRFIGFMIGVIDNFSVRWRGILSRWKVKAHMFKFFKGALMGWVVGLFLVDLLPPEFFLITGLVLSVLVLALFILFHLGVRDFQGD